MIYYIVDGIHGKQDPLKTQTDFTVYARQTYKRRDRQKDRQTDRQAQG